MPRLAVVCDANFYRATGWDAFRSQRARESSHSVLGYASFWTVMELLAHVADPADPAFSPSWQACRRLTEHCVEYDGQRRIVRFLADSESHLCYTLFGSAPPGRERHAEDYGTLLGAVYDAETIQDLAPIQPMLAELKKHVAENEAAFADSVFTHAIKALVPSATSWSDLSRDKAQRDRLLAGLESQDAIESIGAVLAAKAAAEMGLVLSAPELKERGRFLVRVHEAPARFYVSILKRVARDGYDMTVPKNANSVWDFQFAFSTSPSARLNGIPILVVTDDRPVLAAAKEAGAGTHFLSPLDYCALLELAHAEFVEMAAVLERAV